MIGATRKIIADLHTHSTASDGKCSPAEVVRQAKARGYKAVALTDHDTISGLEEALSAAKEDSMLLIPGIEVSLSYKNAQFTGSLHCLVYFPQSNLADPDFSMELKRLLLEGQGKNLLTARIKSINKLFGLAGTLKPILRHALREEEIELSTEAVSSPGFAAALKQNHDLDINTINRLIANTSPAYIPSGVEMARLQSFSEHFTAAKILAHPAAGSSPGPGNYREILPTFEMVLQLLPELLEFGLNGVEVFYPGHTQELINTLIKICDDNKLLVTGGSDFHNVTTRLMGTAGVTEEELDRLLERIGN